MIPWEKIEVGDCWVWQGARRQRGYGYVKRGGRNILAHRLVWEALVGPIPEGLEFDHLCRNTACVNPDHLELVTHRVNVLRGYGRAAQQARRSVVRLVTDSRQGTPTSPAGSVSADRAPSPTPRKRIGGRRRWAWPEARRGTMPMETTKVAHLADLLRGELTQLERVVLAEDELPDAIGLLQEVERKLKAIRQGWEAECEAGAVGELYQAVSENRAERSYNSAEIIRRLLETQRFDSTFHALQAARQAGALKLVWGWTGLRRFLADEGLELEIAAREIEDAGELGGPMVGEVWKRKVRVVPKEEETEPTGSQFPQRSTWTPGRPKEGA